MLHESGWYDDRDRDDRDGFDFNLYLLSVMFYERWSIILPLPVLKSIEGTWTTKDQVERYQRVHLE